MNLLTIKNGVQNWNLQIENVKYVICNSNQYFPLIQFIRQFSVKDKSEYRTENNVSSKIFFNEKPIEIKNNLFIEITEDYSINEDKKLTAKSLMLKYLEVKLQSNEYFDTISTIDILMNSLADEVNDESMLKVLFNGANFKQLIKMLTPFYEDEFQKDEYDLSAEEIVQFQLEMIQYIAENNTKYDHIFVYGKFNYLTDIMIDAFNKMKNCHILIFTNFYKRRMQLKNIAVFQNEIVDLADMNAFYNQYSQHTTHMYPMQEVEQMIIKYLQQNYTQKETDIYQDLDCFSIK